MVSYRDAIRAKRVLVAAQDSGSITAPTIQSSIENGRIVVRTNNDANFEVTAQDELLLLEFPRASDLSTGC